VRGNTSREDRRRAAEERVIDPLWPLLLTAAYMQYEEQGRGAVFIKMTERGVDVRAEPLYVRTDDALRQFEKNDLAEELASYDPRSEVVLVFGYPESLWMRKRFAVDLLTGERVSVDSLARAA
jgi:hypothetical protein